MNKYLITGLGNATAKYAETRHNIGFKVLDFLVEECEAFFSCVRYANICEVKIKNKILILIKPTTYVNLSGKAINYWLREENITLQNLLVIVDEIALPFGAVRIRTKGSDGGHNGLKNINQILGTQNYARIRFGIGNHFPKGQQVSYVLGEWDIEERELLKSRIKLATEAIKSYVLVGPQLTMNQFNDN